MRERYKVLAAITALREFTVEDIAKKTGVKQNTVSTILARERGLLEKIADERTGRRGGPRKKYRLKPGSAESLQSELAGLYKDLPTPAVPLGLLAAEDTLLLRYPNGEDPQEKQRLLRLAKLDYQKGLSESRRVLEANPREETRTAVESSLYRVKALQKFFELDLLAHSLAADHNEEVSAETLRKRLSELSNGVSEAITDLNPVLASVRQLPTSKLRRSERSPIPQNDNYTRAAALLNKASLESDSKEKSELLEEASQALDLVWEHYEDRDTPLTTLAFIRYEQGRLKFLRQDYQNAQRLFDGAREVFATSEKYSDEVTKIDQHLGVLAIERFRQTRPDAPAELEIQTTFAALEGIDSRSQANYPLIKFLQNQLKKTIERSSATEIILRQKLEDAERKIPAPVPHESYRQQIPSMRYGAGVVLVPMEQNRFRVATIGRVEISHERRYFTPEARELRRSVDLGAQNMLGSSYFDEKGPNRSTYDIPMFKFDA